MTATQAASQANGSQPAYKPLVKGATTRQDELEQIKAAHDAMAAELARLRAENEAMKAKKHKLSLKVSEKGALSVYGLGRFPVTLYKEQWPRLLDIAEEIRTFIQANDKDLKSKE